MTVTEKLRKAHLPAKYSRLTDGEKKAARMHTLRSWYEHDRPDILCNDIDSFKAAHFLWAEFYFKSDPMNRGVYFYEDPLCKYDMVEMAMSEPKVSTEPAKAVVHAPRRLGKTQTLIQEMCTMMVLNRPYTQILISQANIDRTREEIRKIKTQVMGNMQIRRDFGGESVLWPRKLMPNYSWKDTHLDFMHLPNCSVLGHSIGSAQRGRGPIFGIIDDPETDEDTYSKKWRKDFFAKLFGTYLNMFHRGGKILWIGTVIHGSSCLAQALQGLSQKDEADIAKDTRFDDWHKRLFSMIDEDDNGELYSQQPERLTVEGFEARKKAQGAATVMAELQGMPITPGQVAFQVGQYTHGYMRCRPTSGEDYFYDLKTGRMVPWPEFLGSLVVYGAGDLADGVGPDSDPGALVFIGIDRDGIRYVLDVFTKRVYAEFLIEQAYTMSRSWHCRALAWERVGMQTVVCRLARRHAEKLRMSGYKVPSMIELPNYRKDKTQRILTLLPYINNENLKFPCFDKITDASGSVHTPAPCSNRRYHRALYSQVQEFTDEGLRGHDDAIDALEMAVRISATAKGAPEQFERHPTDTLMEDWEEAGVPISRNSIPVNLWSPHMLQENLDLNITIEDGGWETVHG